MEINIKAIAGDYAWISEFHTLWNTSYPSCVKYKEKKNLFGYVEIIDKMLEGVQTKYIDVKEAEELENSVENGTRSTKRTKQIENALENIKEILSEDRYKEIKRAFLRYAQYVNFDKEIVLKKSEKLEGCWEISYK